MPDKIIVAVTGTLNSTESNTGSISTTQQEYSGTLEAVAATKEDLVASNSLVGNIATLVDDDSFTGNVSGQDAIEGAAGATLTLRVGQDGQDGKDGFSPTITVHKDTKTEYILKVTNKDGSYLTPNLYPDIEGLQDVQALVAGKVDKDLSDYELVQPTTLTAAQRSGTMLYVNTYNGKAKKIAMSAIALEEEVADRFRTKLRTVTERPNDWRVGDYIFLENEIQADGDD